MSSREMEAGLSSTSLIWGETATTRGTVKYSSRRLVSCKTQQHIKLNAANSNNNKYPADNWSPTKNNSTSNWMQQQINTQPGTDLQNTTAHQTECSKKQQHKNTKLAIGLLQNTMVHHAECSKINNTQLMVSLLQNSTAQNTECSKTNTHSTSSLPQNTEYSKTNNKQNKYPQALPTKL